MPLTKVRRTYGLTAIGPTMWVIGASPEAYWRTLVPVTRCRQLENAPPQSKSAVHPHPRSSGAGEPVLFVVSSAALGPQTPAFVACEDALGADFFPNPRDHFFRTEGKAPQLIRR